MTPLQEEIDWRAGLKAGDEVAILRDRPGAYGHDIVIIAKVDRRTPTQIIVGRDRFSVADGYTIPRASFFQKIVEPTPELRAIAAKQAVERAEKDAKHRRLCARADRLAEAQIARDETRDALVRTAIAWEGGGADAQELRSAVARHRKAVAELAKIEKES